MLVFQLYKSELVNRTHSLRFTDVLIRFLLLYKNGNCLKLLKQCPFSKNINVYVMFTCF